MGFVAIGDLSSSLLLSQASAKAKQNLVKLSTELTSGITTDVRGRLRSDLTKQFDWEHGISKNQVLEKTLSEALTKVTAKQLALGAITENATTFANDVSVATNVNGNAAFGTLSEQARHGLAQTLSHLNTQAMGQSLFAGSYSDKPAVADADSILASVEAYLGNASSATSVIQGVRNWMEDPISGFQSVAYLGSLDDQASIRISNERTIEESVTANSPALRDIVEGFVLAALTAATGPLTTQDQRADLLQTASENLRTANSKIVDLQANVGFVEAVITKAKVSTSAEIFAYEKLRVETLSVDEFETASKLQATELQLEKIYAMTARTARMSLLEYLR